GTDDRTSDSPVPDQQIAAQAQPENRLIGTKRAQEQNQIVRIGRQIKTIGRSSDAPGCVVRQRLVKAQLAPQLYRTGCAYSVVANSGHWIAPTGIPVKHRGSSTAICPILPAPN